MLKSLYSFLSSEKSWFTYFRYKENEDKPNDVRNVLLVVSTVIAAVTFQAGINPPGGVWQEDNFNERHFAGRAIYASHAGAYYVFLISNTMAFSASALVIISLTHRFPFHLEILVATFSMMVTYASAIFAVTPRESVRFRYVVLAGFGPFIFRGFIRLSNKIFGQQKAQPEVTVGRVSH